MARYQGWTGERKQKCKRGFATKREAAQWEQQFILQKKASMDMELESFCKLYEEDVRPRLKRVPGLQRKILSSPRFYRIWEGLMEKVDRMVNRQLYTQSKTASTEEEREKSRQEYLDRRGIPDSFRW